MNQLDSKIAEYVRTINELQFRLGELAAFAAEQQNMAVELAKQLKELGHKEQ